MIMIPPSLLSSILLRRSVMVATTSAVAAATACLLVASSTFLDCNPTLLMRQLWYNNDINRKELRNRSIWIVGASSGIGEELAYQLCSSCPSSASPPHQEQEIEGVTPSSRTGTLFLSARSVDKLEQVAEKCRQLSNHTRPVTVTPMDVTDYQSMQSAVQQIGNTGNVLDVVVLNAGRGHLSPALETTATTTRQVLEQTAVWPMLLTPLIMPLFRTNVDRQSRCRRPHLVVTSSIAALLPVPLSAVYAGSKQALHGYFQSLRAETNARIDLICPGPVDTNFHRNQRDVPVAETPMTTKSRSPVKLSTERCVELIVATMAWPLRGGNGSGRDVWMGPPPTMLMLYLHAWLPTWLTQPILNRVAAKRLEMWRNGLDLYDPANWKKP